MVVTSLGTVFESGKSYAKAMVTYPTGRRIIFSREIKDGTSK
jgi:hypothetical protein